MAALGYHTTGKRDVGQRGREGDRFRNRSSPWSGGDDDDDMMMMMMSEDQIPKLGLYIMKLQGRKCWPPFRGVGRSIPVCLKL